MVPLRIAIQILGESNRRDLLFEFPNLPQKKKPPSFWNKLRILTNRQ